MFYAAKIAKPTKNSEDEKMGFSCKGYEKLSVTLLCAVIAPSTPRNAKGAKESKNAWLLFPINN